MKKTRFVICSAVIIVLAACIVFTGCTSTQSARSSDQTIPSTLTTPSPSQGPTIIPATTAASLAQTAAPAPTISTTTIPMNDPLHVTLNSAEKKTSFGIGTGKPGRVMLILDITLQNTDKNKDFVYTDNSFVLSYASINNSMTSITSQFAKTPGLINPLISGTVPSGSQEEGKIVFGVNETSNSYKLSVVDSTGSVLSSIDTINVP